MRSLIDAVSSSTRKSATEESIGGSSRLTCQGSVGAFPLRQLLTSLKARPATFQGGISVRPRRAEEHLSLGDGALDARDIFVEPL